MAPPASIDRRPGEDHAPTHPCAVHPGMDGSRQEAVRFHRMKPVAAQNRSTLLQQPDLMCSQGRPSGERLWVVKYMSEPAPEASVARPDATIFFSYSRTDLKRARPIIDALELAGYAVWWDGKLEGGTVYLPETERALKAAKAVIVLWSQQSVTSNWVLDEAMDGRADGRLVPLSIQQVTPPLGFRQFQVLDFDRWKGHTGAPEFVELLRAVAVLHGRAAPARAVRQATWPEMLNRRRLLIGGGAALAAAGTGALVWSAVDRGRLLGNGVIVLPFENLNPDAALDYVSTGLATEIRSSLARNPALKVVGETSSQALAGEKLDAQTIARRLRVAHLLEGSFNVEGELARLQISLSAGRTGFQIWSEVFEHKLDNLIALKDMIAEKIVNELTKDVDGPAPSGQTGAPVNANAFNAYLKGLELYRLSKDEETDLASLAQFETAIAADPSFAAAHAARAKTLTVLGNGAASVDVARQYYAQAASAAEAAVQMGPDLADAHSTLGFVRFQAQLKVKDARAPFERSRALGAGDAGVLGRYAGYCAATRRPAEALQAATQALVLDPLNPTLHRAIGFVQFTKRNFRQSMLHVEQALKLNPELGDAHARLGMALIYLDRPAEALEACARERNALVRYPCEAIGYARTGNRARADDAMAALVREYGSNGSYQQAQIFAQWKQPDIAMARLLSAYEVNDSGLTYLDIDPALDSLRDRSDFSSLRQRLGFGID